ncbi:Hypothetical predicted protein [Pelobates cultripes]|uniref:Uncharacterized protein n=1 Tax=Pelobates cultripes TaxID=61616 RepID=A0AAD1WIP8_PELCU|nr:Hypothetical predicted protein [Pelobates cultripes]
MAAEGNGGGDMVPGVSEDAGSNLATAPYSIYLVVAPQTALHQGNGCWKASNTLSGERYGGSLRDGIGEGDEQIGQRKGLMPRSQWEPAGAAGGRSSDT